MGMRLDLPRKMRSWEIGTTVENGIGYIYDAYGTGKENGNQVAVLMYTEWVGYLVEHDNG